MYLSKICFNDPFVLIRRGGSNSTSYLVKQFLCDLFDNNRLASRFFFRIKDETFQDGRGMTIGVLSSNPMPSRIFEMRDVTCQSASYPNQWEKGQRVWFSLLANTVKNLHCQRSDGVRVAPARRLGISNPSEQMSWLAGRDEVREAFRFNRDTDKIEIRDSGVLNIQKGNHYSSHCYADFWGETTVADPNKLSEIVENGIGSAKTFGFGLFLVGSIEAK